MGDPRHPPTEYSEQAILNYALDDTTKKPPTSMRAGLQFVSEATGKGGWVRVPFMGVSPRIECEYSGGNLVYEGHNLTYNAATSATTWIITKSVYDASNNFLRSQTLVGSWTGKGSLDWDI